MAATARVTVLMDHAQRATHERVVRVEVFIDLLREARSRRAFPRY